jgi:transcriptional regulator with XRE-family HTH domain
MKTTSLGLKLKELRLKKGYTLEKLAKLASSSKSYIWELENKSPPRPSAEKLSKIADQLGVTIEYLLDDQSNVKLEDATDIAFYRKYQQLDRNAKSQIIAIINILDHV